MPGYQIFAGVILTINYLAAYWISVDVYIERTHKNRNLNTTITKVFVGLYFFDHYYFAIGRSNNSSLLYSMNTGRNAKKRKYKNPEADCDQ